MARGKGFWAPLMVPLGSCVLGALFLGGLRVRETLRGNYPVAFYGRVVDAQGNALPSVTVHFELLASDRLAIQGRNEKVVKLSAVSDGNGDFELSGLSGYSICIRGFYRGGRGMDYALPQPDPRIPPHIFRYDDPRTRAAMPDTQRRRVSYPLAIAIRRVGTNPATSQP